MIHSVKRPRRRPRISAVEGVERGADNPSHAQVRGMRIPALRRRRDLQSLRCRAAALLQVSEDASEEARQLQNTRVERGIRWGLGGGLRCHRLYAIKQLKFKRFVF